MSGTGTGGGGEMLEAAQTSSSLVAFSNAIITSDGRFDYLHPALLLFSR